MGSKLVLVFYFFSICEHALREKCPYSEFFWSVYSRIRTEYGKIPVFSPTAGKYGPEKVRIRKLFTQ